jgi:hypothetical protein
MTSELPESLEMVARSGGTPLVGAWLVVTLGMTRKNPHAVLVGPTDGNGRVTVARETIEEDVLHVREISPMDYSGLRAWDGTIRVEVMNLERVRRALSAVDMWEELGSLRSEENLGLLREYGERLESLKGQLLQVETRARTTG